ncbi:DUF4129 domain-containing protein [Leptolyngbya sp. FACHB-36]|uniref:DUF4129 domain-containing protein n=1 Tax=Leptolyngbya sp. FACHB-36 TaxID=2692808 RepID=UPI0016815D55|nr:DUF4129 domain-containing protein [Leptolyngbya sp. FACHB-36]MBD2019805.1 DUF4129 domain-containing protein [Leptolyngbya sp. FACHB-36]
MSTDSFQRTNLDWQFQQLSQRIGEWIELRLGKSLGSAPFPTVSPHFVEIAFWLIVSLLVGWLGWQLFWLLRPYLERRSPLQRQSSLTRTEQQTAANWLQQAQTFQRQGNYREACRALYLAMLQRLNDAKRIAHQSSRTDGEYLQLVQQLAHPQPYQTLIATHEQLCFSDAPISAEAFDRCQSAYQQLERQEAE